jgi:hypothetical protein
MAVREKFDPTRPFTAAKSYLYGGVQYVKGQPFNKLGIPDRKLGLLYQARTINMEPAEAATDDPTELVRVITPKKGSYYMVTAPWLAEPLKVKGKVNAEAAAQKLRDDGPPEDEPADPVQVSAGADEGTWIVTAEWLADPEDFTDEEAANARADELRAEGPPEAEKPEGDPPTE